MRDRIEPLRGIWMCWGILLSWASRALPAPLGWATIPLAALSGCAPRTRGTRASLALGMLLEAASLLFCWSDATETPLRIEGGFAVAVDREIRAGRYEGEILEAPVAKLAGRRVRIVLDHAPIGAVLAGRGTLRTPRPARNPGGFDEARWAASAGIAGTLTLDAAHAAGTRPSRWNRFRHVLDASVRRVLADRLDGPSADLWTATLLADGSRLPDDVNTAFRQTGLYHMLSVSGFHLVVLGGAAIALLSLLRAGSRAASLGALCVTWTYVAFLGWPDPALRSAVAFSGFVLARWTGRRAHAGNALGLGAGILVLTDPNCPFQTGVQLTVAATAALVWLAPGLEAVLLPRRIPSFLRSLGRAAIASIAATLATSPILAWNTGLVPWIGIPAGILASGFFSAGFLAALAVATLGTLPAAWSAGFAGAADLCARAVLEIALRAGSWDAGWFQTVRPRPEFLGLWALLLILLSICALGTCARRRALISIALLASFFLRDPRPLPRDVLAIDFLDVGQGDAALLRTPDGSAWLVDGGPATRGPRPRDAGTDAIVPALRALRVERLDGIVVTHPDLDHWGGVPATAAAMPPRLLLEPGTRSPDPSAGWDSARARILRNGTTRPMGVLAGQFLTIGRHGALVALAPGSSARLPDRNSGSLVLSIRWGRARALLTGDAEAWSEERMLAHSADLRADLLKVAHHGSKGASTAPFLAAVRPRWALVSCGERNRYGHPHRDALERIAATGARILDTREGGWKALLHTDGRVEIDPARRRWWNGPWHPRGDLSLPPSWIWNGLSGKSSKARTWSAAPCGESSTPTTNCPTASRDRARTDRS